MIFEILGGSYTFEDKAVRNMIMECSDIYKGIFVFQFYSPMANNLWFSSGGRQFLKYKSATIRHDGKILKLVGLKTICTYEQHNCILENGLKSLTL